MAANGETAVRSSEQTAHLEEATEQPLFFELGDEQLFGFLHLPPAAPRGGIVLCHAFGEEKLWSHRIYVTFSREMAAAGYAVLRFDMRGEGDSDRDFEESSIETRVEDVARAVKELRARVGDLPTVTLLGHRLGGSIAAAAVSNLSVRVDALVIWDPLPNGEEYFGQLLRSNLAAQLAAEGKVTRTRDALLAALVAGETVLVDGYSMTAALYGGISALNWTDLQRVGDIPTLVLEVAKSEDSRPSPQFAQLSEVRANMRCEVVTEPPFWRETRQFHRRADEFTGATVRWLGGL